MATGKIHSPDLGYIPPPPPLPKYDPNEEAPKWNRSRMRYNLPVDKGSKPWTPTGTQPESPDDPDWRGVIKNNVIEYPVVEPYKHGQPIDPKYFWFDTPDYADPFKKLGYSLKFFCQTGLAAMCVRGTFDAMRFTTANNIFLARKVFFPWVLGGMCASMSVIIVAGLRGKKDDIYNYLPAGLLLGAILGRKDHRSYVRWTVGMVPAAMFAKYNAEINGQIWPKVDINWAANWSISGQSTEHGVKSGDFRLFRSTHGEPGRDVRKPW